MTDGFRLDRYLARIGFDGPVAPDLATLTAIHAAQVEALPVEGLNPLLGLPVKLDMASVQQKLVDGRRGGYCYELNALLRAALVEVGFKVTGLGGRVRWNAPPDSPLGPRAHMLLRVDLPDGPYLADVGFGACVLDAPLRLAVDIEQQTATGTYRLTEADGLLSLSAKRPGGWRTMYVFDLTPQLPADYELGNWYTSTSPFMPFTSMLVMERVSGDRRTRLVNRHLTVEGRDGEPVSERVLGSAAELQQVLDETFGITPPASADEIFAIISGNAERS
ncbi:arylamine N-acetyltransferase [Tardiphaga sp.]|uniref:arylamine N-acetyltransferase family protein n=1 Tax=Tardiphaga sp. TaxID=1926292 RepID=UPI00352BCE24